MSRPCDRCGAHTHTGEGRVAVQLTADELEELAFATSNPIVRARLLCALDLIDHDRAARVVTELAALR